jgi:hypothetical protein
MRRSALAPIVAAWVAMATLVVPVASAAPATPVSDRAGATASGRIPARAETDATGTAGAGLAAESQDRGWDRFEIGLFGGYGRTRALGVSSYLRESDSTFYARIVASDIFTFDPASAIYAGGWCTYYLTPGVGIQAGFGYLKSTMPGTSSFRLESFRDATAVVRESWTGQGEITAVPLSLNLVGRFSGGGFDVRASGGLSVFLNSFLAEMPGGVEAVEPVWKASGGSPSILYLADEKLDTLKVPLTAPDTTWTALGVNFGAGFDIWIGRSAALSVEARYYLCPAKTFDWGWTPGVYNGIGAKITGWNFTADAARAAGQQTTGLSVNPSFFQVSAGIRFYFPGPSID